MSQKRKYEVGQPSTVKRRAQPVTSINAKAPRSRATQNQMKKQSPLQSASTDVNIKSQNSGGSQHSNFLCGICFNYKPLFHMFNFDMCNHAFCFACMANHVTSQINQNIVKVTCPHPNCNTEQTPISVLLIFAKKVIEIGTALCESTNSLKHEYEVGQTSTVKRRDQPIASIDAKAPCSAAQNQMKKQSPLHGGIGAPTDVNFKSQNIGGTHSNFLCGICFDYKSLSDTFKNDKCNHAFCCACMAKYVASQIDQNIVKVTCPHPNCSFEQNPQSLHPILPQKVIEKWDTAICESKISASHKIYCPFKDCSVLLVKDRGEVVTRCECPSCHRLFCAQCRVPWHARVTSCEEFQRMKKRSYVDQDLDNKFFKLAKDRNWRKCPYCNMFVQRDGGCEHIACRCGGDFCYHCGKNWTFGHICEKRHST